MRILLLTDLLSKLRIQTDSSFNLGQEFARQGHEIWHTDPLGVYAEGAQVLARAKHIEWVSAKELRTLKEARMPLSRFGIVLTRIEPPFDLQYLHLTQLLDLTKKQTFIHNDPSGIRNANEKLSILNFPKNIPPTLVSCDTDEILKFQKTHKRIVVKPLHLKWGLDIQKIDSSSPANRAKIDKLVHHGKNFVVVQKFITGSEKRIIIIGDKILSAYAKIQGKGDFRTNFYFGGTYGPTIITQQDLKVVRTISPYLIKEGLHMGAIDVLNGKLLEINVTCPGGIYECNLLYPERKVFKIWADFLLKKASARN